VLEGLSALRACDPTIVVSIGKVLLSRVLSNAASLSYHGSTSIKPRSLRHIVPPQFHSQRRGAAFMLINKQDFFSGTLFLAVGTVFAWGSAHYEIGTANFMGPGYYPRLLGVLAMIVGAAIIIMALINRTGEATDTGKWAWKGLALILSANIFFGIAIGGLPSIGLPPLGLAIGVYVLVCIAFFASGEFKWREYIALSTILLVGIYAICVKVLNLYVPLLPMVNVS
jgi:hypothetical protein